MDPITGIPLGRRRVRLTTYNNCFTGTDACIWLTNNLDGVVTAHAAQACARLFGDTESD